MAQSNPYASNTRKHTAVALASVNATIVAAAPALQILRVIGGQINNTTAAWIYLKIFDKATAPTVGTDTPVLNMGIPPAGQIDLTDMCGTDGLGLTNGLAYAITGAIALLDNTAVTAGVAAVNLTYA